MWSGAREHESGGDVGHWERLVSAMRELLEYARPAGVRLSFEPEPGMLVARMDQFDRLREELGDELFGLTLDIGHIHCLEDGEAKAHIQEHRGHLWNVHIEDMRRGVHEHLFFGDGEIRFPPVIDALRKCDYAGPVHVELSRHSHDAVMTAARAFQFLKKTLRDPAFNE
jgi:L-ribulose-5-phosphate 3-epimerase